MAPQSEGGASSDNRMYTGAPAPGEDSRYGADRDGVPRTTAQQQLMPHNNGYSQDYRRQNSPRPHSHGQNQNQQGGDGQRESHDRDRSRTRQTRKGSGQIRLCKKCGEPLTGQFVRALGGTYHLDCFKCRVSGTSTSRNLLC
jgi:hypothetical protein